jgi:hypothetical protein
MKIVGYSIDLCMSAGRDLCHQGRYRIVGALSYLIYNSAMHVLMFSALAVSCCP